MRFATLLRYLLLPVYRPRDGVRQLLAEEQPRKLAYALLVFLFLGVIYTVSVQAAYMRGFGAQVTPFIAIPAARYYFWQRFYQIPLFVLINVVFAGTARLVAAAFKGSGTYEDAFSLCCLAMTFPMFLTMWLPETIMFFATPVGFWPAGAWGTVWLWFQILRQVAGVVWPLIVLASGIAVSERIGWLSAAIVTLVAFLPTGALMVIFIR